MTNQIKIRTYVTNLLSHYKDYKIKYPGRK